MVFRSGCMLNVSWELEKYRGMGPTYRHSEFIVLGVYPEHQEFTKLSRCQGQEPQIWSKQVNSAITFPGLFVIEKSHLTIHCVRTIVTPSTGSISLRIFYTQAQCIALAIAKERKMVQATGEFTEYREDRHKHNSILQTQVFTGKQSLSCNAEGQFFSNITHSVMTSLHSPCPCKIDSCL